MDKNEKDLWNSHIASTSVEATKGQSINVQVSEAANGPSTSAGMQETTICQPTITEVVEFVAENHSDAKGTLAEQRLTEHMVMRPTGRLPPVVVHDRPSIIK